MQRFFCYLICVLFTISFMLFSNCSIDWLRWWSNSLSFTDSVSFINLMRPNIFVSGALTMWDWIQAISFNFVFWLSISLRCSMLFVMSLLTIIIASLLLWLILLYFTSAMIFSLFFFWWVWVIMVWWLSKILSSSLKIVLIDWFTNSSFLNSYSFSQAWFTSRIRCVSASITKIGCGLSSNKSLYSCSDSLILIMFLKRSML